MIIDTVEQGRAQAAGEMAAALAPVEAGFAQRPAPVTQYIQIDPNDELKMVTLGQGAFFGEMGLISGRRRTATVVRIDAWKGGAHALDRLAVAA